MLQIQTKIEPPKGPNDIIWTDRSCGLRDQTLAKANFERVSWLMEACTVTEAISNDYARNIPFKYDYKGVAVEFLPHWGCYNVGPISLEVPSSKEQLLSDLETVFSLKDRFL